MTGVAGPTGDDVAARPLVLGLGVTGAAVTAAVARRGGDVVVVDDHPEDPTVQRRCRDLDIEVRPAPVGPVGWAALLAGRSAFLPSPGVPDAHPAFAAARHAGVPVRSELDLAAGWDNRPVLAITGTNGKTTVTTLVTEMLTASGRRAVDAGNTEVPLVTAIDDPDVDVFVVEASSFRLGHTDHVAPLVGTWLNFAPDHLDVHASLAAYEAAKARIWQHLRPDGTAVANADDSVVVAHAPTDGRTTTFGLGGAGSADWTVIEGRLQGPDGQVAAEVGELWRAMPHDLANALAAMATALAGGATMSGCRVALLGFGGLHHRVELVGEHGGVAYYDDSKATTPHATLAAVSGFESVVLVAGGRNKGLDLSGMTVAAPHLRAVVAIGEAADELAAAFEGVRPVQRAASMAEAVDLAAAAARPGDAVLLSPGCASFDWYRSYGERGDDFAAEVARRIASAPPGDSRPSVPTDSRRSRP